jgi:hypothetical protein
LVSCTRSLPLSTSSRSPVSSVSVSPLACRRV